MRIEYSKPDGANHLTFELRDLGHPCIRRVAEELVEASVDPASLLRTDGPEEAWHFKVVCIFPNGIRMTEKEFWERASDFPDLHPLAVEYARNVSAPGRGRQGTPLWHDDWVPAGCYAVAPLTFKDTRFFDSLVNLAHCRPLQRPGARRDLLTPETYS
ncbi:MAG: hypothetical protein OEZ06_32045 [Myxococcales bacterium]|nr:hypothetical protein [Myxococcales bacterium]